MVREADHSGGVTLSSIALLQERFRQLQRMKELRQERELMRTLSESERCAIPPPAVLPNPMRRSATFPDGQQPVFTPSPPPPPAQLALSLWPDSQTKHAESRALKAVAEAPFQHHSPPARLLPSWPQFNPDNDIDTSLRL